jgi:hypothetical protein
MAGPFRAVLKALRDFVVVGFVRLPKVGGVEGNCTFLSHPVDGGAGVQSAGECNADAFADR